MRKCWRGWITALVVAFALSAGGAFAGPITGEFVHGTVQLEGGGELGYAVQANPLAAPNYDWWYGCSPTSAGMMLGYYDINGYMGLAYPNLVPGGVAEMNTFGNPGALANGIIASPGHIADFWVAYGQSEDTGSPDPMTQNHTFDSLADFMGTSQDDVLTPPEPEGSNDNVDGGTMFWFYTTGAKLTAADILGVGYHNSDGMYGVGEYVQYAGYNYVTGGLYTQLTDNDAFGYGFSGGFTFSDFMAEIDADRPVLIHIEGHTMCGYGYSSANNQILVYDTWNDADGAGPWTDGQNPGTMTWGGSYGGSELWGVTVLELTGGEEPGQDIIPEPTTVALLGMALAALARRRRRS